MRTAKIGELKARLSAHIAYVKQGEEVLILDRNTPVARLVAVGAAGSGDEDARLRRLAAKGIVRMPQTRQAGAMNIPEPSGAHKVSRAMLESVLREEREGR